jgi:hypothetical protein
MDFRANVDFPFVLASQVTIQENGQARAREAEDIEHAASSVIWLDRGTDKRNPDEKRKSLVGKLSATKVRDDSVPVDVPLSFAKAMLDRARICEMEDRPEEVAGPRQEY